MLSILQLDLPAEEVRAQPEPTPEPVTAAAEEIPVAVEEKAEAARENPEEFEIVMGRAQVASVLFVAVVVVVVFSAISYLAGRALSPKAIAAREPVAVAAPVLEATVVRAPDFPLPEPIVKEPAPAEKPVVQTASVPEPAVFSNPSANALYLQMGAVEKGVAVIMVDGLRKRGFPAFAAPGPTEVIFRVLIGPLADGESFRITKERIEQIGLNSFVRKYQP
jgi:hypothetical protein